MSRAIDISNDFASAANIVWVNLFLGDIEAAELASERFAVDFPRTFWRYRGPFFVAHHRGDTELAWTAADALQSDDRAPQRWQSRARLYRSFADAHAGRRDRALEGLRSDIAVQVDSQRWGLAVARSTDLIWLLGVFYGDREAAQIEAQRLVEGRWLARSGDSGALYFRVVRDAARVGAVDVAERVRDQWLVLDPGNYALRREEDLAAAEALLAGARGQYDYAVSRLVALIERSSPQHPPDEWPSARHCQRCWRFDIARLLDEAGQPALAGQWYARVLSDTEDLVETPLNRLRAREWGR